MVLSQTNIHFIANVLLCCSCFPLLLVKETILRHVLPSESTPCENFKDCQSLKNGCGCKSCWGLSQIGTDPTDHHRKTIQISNRCADSYLIIVNQAIGQTVAVLTDVMMRSMSGCRYDAGRFGRGSGMIPRKYSTKIPGTHMVMKIAVAMLISFYHTLRCLNWYRIWLGIGKG
jgi:hypothetical protein